MRGSRFGVCLTLLLVVMPSVRAEDELPVVTIRRPSWIQPSEPIVPDAIEPAQPLQPADPTVETAPPIVPASWPWNQRYCPPAPYPMAPYEPKQVPDSKTDPKVDPKQAEPPPSDAFAGATETGTQPGAMYNPNVFGDFIGISALRRLAVPGQFVVQPVTSTQNVRTVTVTNIPVPPFIITTITNTPVTTTTLTSTPRIAALEIPLAGRYQGVKVADNESPRPTDRIYFNYNGYGDVNRAVLPATFPNLSLDYQTLGFERTFMQGDASFGMRLPFVQLNGFSTTDVQAVGDITFLFKYAWINNRQTGDVFSIGLAMTIPSGGNDDVILYDGSQAPHSTLFQPWLGWIYNLPGGFVQGFSSIIAPSDSRDPTIMFNSVAVGWWLYRSTEDRIVTSFVPIAELHVNTPLNHRSSDELIIFRDQFNLTLGAYATLQRMTIGGAASIPLAGPRPFDVEGIVSINYRY